MANKRHDNMLEFTATIPLSHLRVGLIEIMVDKDVLFYYPTFCMTGAGWRECWNEVVLV